MHLKRLTGLALGLGLVLGALAGPAQAQIKLGVAGPLTGSDAAFGTQLKNGAEQAVQDINAAGGINGQQIALSVADDRGDPKEGVSVANKLVGDGVRFLVGHFNSGVSIPVSEVYQESNVLQITPASTNPAFTERRLWNVFRTCGTDEQQGNVAGTYIAQNFKGKKVAVVHDKSPYGKGLADFTRKAMNAGGVREVLYEGVNKGEKDFSALISKLKQAGVDLVYFGGIHTEAGLIVRQMRDQGLNAPLMAGDGIVSSEFAAIAGPGAEGTLVTFGPDPRKNPAAAEVVARFRAKNIDPESYTLYSYAAVQILKQAIEGAGSTDPKKVAEFMRSGRSFNTVIGPIAFDKKGDITRADYIVYAWRKAPNGTITYENNELTQ